MAVSEADKVELEKYISSKLPEMLSRYIVAETLTGANGFNRRFRVKRSISTPLVLLVNGVAVYNYTLYADSVEFASAPANGANILFMYITK